MIIPKVQCLDETSWTEWVNSSSCEINTLTNRGFQYQTRCRRNTENEADNFDTCHDEYNVIECTPKERLLNLTDWSDWTPCRGYNSSTCPGRGQRAQIRNCENGCAFSNITQQNLTEVQNCDVTEDGFQTKI